MKTIELFKEDFTGDCWECICDELDVDITANSIILTVSGVAVKFKQAR